MDKNKQQHLNMKEKVLLQIDVDGLAMHSKRYFTLKAAFFIIVAFFALVIAVLISNFILFTIRISGYDSLLGFGPKGLLLFVQLFPWILLSIDIILVLILQTLIRQFHFGYSKPSLYMFLVLVFLTVSTGLIVDRSSDINEQLMIQAHHKGLWVPLGGEAQPDKREGVICKCIIVSISQDSITAYNTSMGTSTMFTIFIPEGVMSTIALNVGDEVYIAGDREQNVFRAFGIQKL